MISIVMGYVNRLEQLKKTLDSISKSVVKNIEIIVVDDFSDPSQSASLLLNEFSFLNLKVIDLRNYFVDDKKHSNPCIAYNIGFRYVSYDKVIIQNPECCHLGDVLKYTLDHLTDDNYLTFNCFSLDKEDTEKFYRAEKVHFNEHVAGHNGSCWYNHEHLRPVGYHFTSAITLKNLKELNGFDEKFAYGIGFDDDEFLFRVKNKKLNVQFVNQPMVLHLYHENSFGQINSDKIELNRNLFFQTQQNPKVIDTTTVGGNTWNLINIPKIAHFYWGGAPLSYLRYLSVYSFAKLNPDWVINVYTSPGKNKVTWATDEQKHSYDDVDYFKYLSDINNVNVINYDFENTIVEHAHHVHKSDFLRWEILSTQGGLWSDFDVIYYNPVANLFENNEKNSEMASTVCPYDKGLYKYYNTIGFILSKPNSNFMKFLKGLIKIKFKDSEYQSIGAELINVHFWDVKAIVDYCEEYVVKLHSHCIYSIPLDKLELLVDPVIDNNLKFLRDPSILGFHWYGGDPLFSAFEKKFNPNTVVNFNNLIRHVYNKIVSIK